MFTQLPLSFLHVQKILLLLLLKKHFLHVFLYDPLGKGSSSQVKTLFKFLILGLFLSHQFKSNSVLLYFC